MCGIAQSVTHTEHVMVGTSMSQMKVLLYVLQNAWLHKGCLQGALSAASSKQRLRQCPLMKSIPSIKRAAAFISIAKY